MRALVLGSAIIAVAAVAVWAAPRGAPQRETTLHLTAAGGRDVELAAPATGYSLYVSAAHVPRLPLDLASYDVADCTGAHDAHTHAYGVVMGINTGIPEHQAAFTATLCDGGVAATVRDGVLLVPSGKRSARPAIVILPAQADAPAGSVRLHLRGPEVH